MIITAVAVTAVLCVAGVYFLTSGESEKQDIHVAVSSDVTDLEGFGSFFDDFNENARAVVNVSTHDAISSAEDIEALLSDGNVAVMTFVVIDPVSGMERITVEGIFIFYHTGAEGMEGFFISWLIGLSI